MSGNGADLGSIVAMLQGVLQAQEAMRGEMAALRSELRGEMHAMRGELRNEIAELRADHGRKLDDLRQTLTQYHSSVLGHGILITELDTRLRRVEQHLDLPSTV